MKRKVDVMNRKLFVAYRIYPKLSKNADTTLFKNKYEMFVGSLNSFLKALEGVDYHIHFILDSCPQNYSEFIKGKVPESRFDIENLVDAGNAKTFKRQVEVLLKQNFSELVYFAEDDYLYYPNSIIKLIDFLSKGYAHFVSPYDHPDYYADSFCYKKYLHDYASKIFYNDGLHFRVSSSTTLTFLTSTKILSEVTKVFQLYGHNSIGDYEVWIILTHTKMLSNNLKSSFFMYLKAPIHMLFKSRYLLCTPVPGLAVHLSKPCTEKMAYSLQSVLKSNGGDLSYATN